MSEETTSSVAVSADSGSEQSSGQSFDTSQAKTGSSTQTQPSRPVPGGRDQQNGQPKKEESRYERTKRERAEFKAKQQAFEQERQDFARQRQEFEASKKPKHDYTLAQLKQYRKEWASEAEMGVPGREQLVEKADQRIAQMEAEEKQSKMVYELPKYGTREHRQIWEQAEQQLRTEDPEFMKPGSRLDTWLRKILSGPNADMYRGHAYGIYAAYDAAQKEILKEDNLNLQNKIKELTSELERVSGFSSISGGAPGQVTLNGKMSGDSREFSKLSSAEMKKRILAHQKGNTDTSMPWM